MKHINRYLIIVSVMIGLVPLATGLSIVGDLVSVTRFQLEDARERAKDQYRESAHLDSLSEESERAVRESTKQLQSLGKRKRDVRLKIAAILREIDMSHNRADQMVIHQERAIRAYHGQRDALAEFVRGAHARQLTALSGPSVGADILRKLLGHSLGDSVAAELRDDALARAREEVIQRLLIARESSELSRDQLHAAAGVLGDELAVLQDERETLIREYRSVLETLDRASYMLRVSEEELKEVRRITAQVENDILQMQSELARIDGRLRARAERELIQMGLMEDRPDRFRPRITGRGDFLWPASGPISAGYKDERYHTFFGVPHKGIDIVVPHGSSVHAAADGIVYLVRLGGATGYTYVLIGHRDGYATLYGHLSSVLVQAGDQVNKGEQIGHSGGTRGTDGAGPMTTGAHLHFEVIVRGEHVDPRTVLQ